MGPAKQAAKSRLREYLETQVTGTVTEWDWDAILREFPSVSAGYLRRLVRESGRSLAPLVEGVRQRSLEELERTLLAIQTELESASQAGRRDRCTTCRELVIEAKDHARWALRRSSTSQEQRLLKQEMVEWMLVWLNDPGAFPAWARLRRKVLKKAGADER